MSATFDTTTKAAYNAATSAAARATAIVASLSSGGSPEGAVLVKVYNGASPDVEMGSGTMTAPWATASGGTVVIGEVSSFTVGTTGTPDANWYIKFRTLDGTRWVRASFGLVGSGQDFTWSLATFTDGQTGTIGTATIVCTGNAAPVFTVAPTSSSIASTGGTIQFTATDPDGGAILYSLTTTRSGITINSTTGLVTVTAAAAGSSGDIVVRASDGILTADTSCAVTVAPVSTGAIDYEVSFESTISPFVASKTTGAIVQVDSAHRREGTKSLLTRLPDPSQWRAEVEIGYGSALELNAPNWIGFSLYLPNDWAPTFNTWEVIGQLHGIPDSGDEWTNPVMAFDVSNGSMRVFVRWDSRPNSVLDDWEGEKSWTLDATSTYLGHWTDFVIYMVPHWTTSGRLRIWQNGVERITLINAPNTSNDSRGPYWKMGIYNGWRYGASTPGVTQRTCWWDCYRQVSSASATYADVAPRGDRLSAT